MSKCDTTVLAERVLDALKTRTAVNRRRAIFTFNQLGEMLYVRDPSGGKPTQHEIEQAARLLGNRVEILFGRVRFRG